MANLNSVTTNYFPVSSETYTNNINATLGAGATVVPVNSASAYADGDVVVLTVDPGTASQATFTGVKASTPDRFINCFWTEGNTGVGHSNGAVITDYDSATHYDLVTKGVRSFANQDGTLKTTAVQQAIGISNTPSVGWNVMAQGLTWTGHNGNGEYTANFTGDVNNILSNGMKILAPRGATPPSQAMSFVAASSQYASKATPAGITFTSAFTCEAWIYVNSYANNATIISRRDGSNNGWELRLNGTNGQLEVLYASAGYTSISSYQSIPLKRWVHVAGVVSNVSTKTASLYIDGVLVPSFINLTAVTTLTQAGNLQVGAANSVEFFDGSISEARVWSVAQTQAQIQANKDIALTGAEANLVGLFQGNGNFNDKTTNANNLTASGGAVATTTLASISNTPYAAQNEYFIVTKVGTFSGGLTPVTLFGGQAGHLPNATIGTVQYSNARIPYGFPAQKAKWTVTSILATTFTITSSGFNIWQSIPSYQLTTPTGEWDGTIVGTAVQNNSASAGSSFLTTFAPTSNGAAGYDIYANQTENNSASIGNVKAPISLKIPITMTSSGTLTPYMRVNGGGGTVLIGIVNAVFTAECAYL